MEAAVEAVKAVQEALQLKGVEGRKTSQAALNELERARALVERARRMEEEITAAAAAGGAGSPPLTLERIQQVTDLYREAIERLSSASDEKRKVRLLLWGRWCGRGCWTRRRSFVLLLLL